MSDRLVIYVIKSAKNVWNETDHMRGSYVCFTSDAKGEQYELRGLEF